jgi:hypothetical protein
MLFSSSWGREMAYSRKDPGGREPQRVVPPCGTAAAKVFAQSAVAAGSGGEGDLLHARIISGSGSGTLVVEATLWLDVQPSSCGRKRQRAITSRLNGSVYAFFHSHPAARQGLPNGDQRAPGCGDPLLPGSPKPHCMVCCQPLLLEDFQKVQRDGSKFRACNACYEECRPARKRRGKAAKKRAAPEWQCEACKGCKPVCALPDCATES